MKHLLSMSRPTVRWAMSVLVAATAAAVPGCADERSGPGGEALVSSAEPSTGGGAPSAGTMFVSYMTGATEQIVQLDAQGNLLNQFGSRPFGAYYSHLALAGGLLYRTNADGSCTPGSPTGSIDEFSLDGTL